MNLRPCSILRVVSLQLVGVFLLCAVAWSEERQPDLGLARPQGVTAQHGMVVAQEAQAARIGVDVLKKGGNAVDAAVAVGFAMAVTYPRAGNIGGGGFMVIHRANGDDVTIDYRETAPQAINEKSFLDDQGNADPHKSRDSALGIGVPGTVAGLALAEEKYGSGRFSLADLIAPAIALARDGIVVTDDTADSLPNDHARLARWPASAKIFLKADGSALGAGDHLVQSDLADTLEAIAQGGPRAFYQGPTAYKIAAAVQAAGGVMTVDDLNDYHAIERAPVRGTYRGYDIVSMPPPSSGGVDLIEMLNVLEGYDLAHEDEAQATPLAGRNDEARLRRSRAISRRSGHGVGAGGAADVEKLCCDVARHHRSGARDAGRMKSAPAARLRPKAITPRIFPSPTASAMPSRIPIR